MLNGKYKPKINLIPDRDFIMIAIVSVIAAGGLITIATLAPSSLRLLRTFKKYRYHKLKKGREAQRKSYITTKAKDLCKKGIINIDKFGNLSLTDTGQRLLEKYQIKEKRKDQKPDGKWRVIIFDIKEKQRKKRDYFRAEIAEAGFRKLQGSVWISPYPNNEFIELLRAELEFSKSEIIYFEADKISCPEEILKKIF
ncbi:MAG: repressor [Candidatus Gottesmanbacteria bacterium GW2011_GWA2_42_16]|nr:MAG: repressor [Candidatus Gottesmanbacteria bacterium GW2011_GWA2_42_16]